MIIVDITLGPHDGRDVCEALRGRGLNVPVLFLTARTDLVDRLAAFQSGGDDYLTKPFDVEELVARVRALVRRSGTGPAAPPASGAELALEPSAHAAVVHGQRIELSRLEFRLLAALLSARPGVVHRTTLATAAWPEGAEVGANTLESCVTRLRAKLRDAGSGASIVTVRGTGYRLN